MNFSLKIKPKLADRGNKINHDALAAFSDNFDSDFDEGLNKTIRYINDTFSGKTVAAGQIPEGYKVVQRYPLVPPFCYTSIIQSNDYSDFLYTVDEIPLGEEETKIYNSVKELLEKEIDSPRLIDDIEAGFTSEVNRLLQDHVIGNKIQPIMLETVRYYLKRDILGYGIIDPFFHDVHVEDISCGGPEKPIFIYHRKYEGLSTNVLFPDHESVDSFVMKMIHRAGKHVSAAHPIVDASLPGNHRVAALYKNEVSTKGSSFTIRKFREDPITIVDLINLDTLDVDIASYLWFLVDNKKSLMVIGSTGGGKTTILNAVTGLINPAYKIFSVEDTAEINIPHENWFSLVSRSSFGMDNQGEVGLFDLLKSGMRHRPDYILVGEIRSEEAYVLFQALATGHGGMATMHADNSEAAVKRLIQKPMDIPPSYIPLMNCIVSISRVKLRTRSHGRSGRLMSRRITEVTEITSSNNLQNVFAWDAHNDGYFDDLQKSEQLFKIAQSQGLDIQDILKDLDSRKKVLRWLVNREIRDYQSVSKVMSMFNREPDRLLAKVANL